MQRRGFLKLLGIGAPAVAVATQLPETRAHEFDYELEPPDELSHRLLLNDMYLHGRDDAS